MSNEDYRDLVALLVAHEVRFLVVGAHALAAHGYPRATVDLDLWIERSTENAHRVWRALAEFGAPLDDLDIEQSDLSRPNIEAQFGLPPWRIDILTDLTALSFDDAWARRAESTLEGVRVPVLGRDDLIWNKLATGRNRDRVDAEELGAGPETGEKEL